MRGGFELFRGAKDEFVDDVDARFHLLPEWKLFHASLREFSQVATGTTRQRTGRPRVRAPACSRQDAKLYYCLAPLGRTRSCSNATQTSLKETDLAKGK